MQKLFSLQEYDSNGIDPIYTFYDAFKIDPSNTTRYYIDGTFDENKQILEIAREWLNDLRFNTRVEVKKIELIHITKNNNTDEFGETLDNNKIVEHYLIHNTNCMVTLEFSESRFYIIVLMGDTSTLSQENENLLNNFLNKLKSIKVDVNSKNFNKFNIICKDNAGLRLREFKLPAPKNEKINFFDCYNEDLESVYNHILKSIESDNRGLVLLHGDPGTGKTSFLKRIIESIGNKKLIYLPPDMTEAISSPDFFTFLLDNPNSVLLIEDAENVLRHREAGGNQAVSNILNVSEGILGSALGYQIIATFNSDLDTIDQALLRPGRLIARYKFDKLSIDRSNNLIEKLYGDDIPFVDKPHTLAEVFHLDKQLFNKQIKKHPIGFTNLGD